MNKTRSRGLLSFAVACSLLAGCASTSPSPSSQQVQAATRNYLDSITLGGRLSIQYQQNDKDESLHGSFEWSQTAARTLVTLRSPLGQVLATIDVTPGSATLVQAGKAPVSARDVDRLAADTLGWPLPVSGLRTWLQGFAHEAGNRTFVAIPGGPEEARTADGWHLRYASWAGEGAARPKRIDLDRSTVEAGKVSIRIVIDSWQEG